MLVETLTEQVSNWFSYSPDVVRLSIGDDETLIFWIGMGSRVILKRLPDGDWIDTRFTAIFGVDGTTTSLRVPRNRARRASLRKLYGDSFEGEHYR